MDHGDKPSPEQPMILSEEYLRHIKIVESLPENQSGADKTWVERTYRASMEHYAKARRVR
jgi:hypothetical protein